MSDTKIDDGGPAFPLAEEWVNGREQNNGMTLRDWFAGQALAGYLADTRCPDRATPDIVAKWCYSNADAMLDARKEKV